MSSRPSHFPLTSEGPLRLYSTKELLALPPPTWLVDPILPSGGLVGLYGMPGVGKSFIAIDIAMAVATGQSWQGHTTEPGYVVYVSAEGGTGIGKRVKAWMQTHAPTREPQIAWLIESIPIYADSEQMAVLLNRIVEEIQVHPKLIIVDTLARCFDGDENQQEDMGRFIAGIDVLRYEFKSTLIAVHHTRLDGERERGNTAFRGAADAMIAVHEINGSIDLECTKQKDAEPFETISQRRIVVPGTESCVMVPFTTQDPMELGRTMEMLNVLTQIGPVTWDSWFSSMNLPKSTFHRYFVELKRMGKILKENGEWRVSGAD